MRQRIHVILPPLPFCPPHTMCGIKMTVEEGDFHEHNRKYANCPQCLALLRRDSR